MIQAIRGTKDIWGDSLKSWYFVEKMFRETSSLFGYSELRTPIFEKTEVFDRTIGEGTDIVNKEMYTFIDKGGESITLRPEMTAALVRSLVQNNIMTQSVIQRLWYFGPFFRFERPQKGRLRQFHQYGAECLGSPYPESDVEVLMLADKLFHSIGIDDYKLNINSLGNKQSRNNYREALIDYLNKNKQHLSSDSMNRIDKNPLRVLDSKEQQDIEILVNSPSILDFLDSDSLLHFNNVKESLTSNGIDFVVNPRLVRGLDYYCHTVFEFQSSLLGSQDSFGGGGRYDGLVEQLGGTATPAVGFALGVERLLIILEGLNYKIPSNDTTDFYIITMNTENVKYGIKVAASLRERGYSTIMDLNRRSFKSQLRDANKQQARYAAIIGDNEMENGTIVMKNMNSGEQHIIEFNKLSETTF